MRQNLFHHQGHQDHQERHDTILGEGKNRNGQNLFHHQGHQVRKRQNNALGLKPQITNCLSFDFSLTQESFALLGVLGALGGEKQGGVL